MRFLFRPPADEAAGLMALPWERPLGEWPDDVLLHVPQRGRHLAARRPDRRPGRPRLRAQGDRRAAGPHGVRPADRPRGRGSAHGHRAGHLRRPPGRPARDLVTRYLEYSVSYRYLFSNPRGEHSVEQLIDTMVELVRLHLAGIFWGDCSLSNTLFRPDAGTMAAYLVDAETVDRHATLSRGQRLYDVDLATDRVGAELMDLEFGGMLPRDIDPIELAHRPARQVRGAVSSGRRNDWLLGVGQ